MTQISHMTNYNREKHQAQMKKQEVQPPAESLS